MENTVKSTCDILIEVASKTELAKIDFSVQTIYKAMKKYAEQFKPQGLEYENVTHWMTLPEAPIERLEHIKKFVQEYKEKNPVFSVEIMILEYLNQLEKDENRSNSDDEKKLIELVDCMEKDLHNYLLKMTRIAIRKLKKDYGKAT